jgi:hypothetical protein
MNTKDTLKRLIEKYSTIGIIKGAEFLLPHNEALSFADDLGSNGFTILGVDGWYYVDRDKRGIIQDLEVDLAIEDSVLKGSDPVRSSVAIAKQFIANSLPERTEFVSFTIDVPYWRDLFLNV